MSFDIIEDQNPHYQKNDFYDYTTIIRVKTSEEYYLNSNQHQQSLSNIDI